MEQIMMLPYIRQRNRRLTVLAYVALFSTVSLVATIGTLALFIYSMIVYVETLEYTVTPFMVWMLRHIVWFVLGSLGCVFFLKPEVRERIDMMA